MQFDECRRISYADECSSDLNKLVSAGSNRTFGDKQSVLYFYYCANDVHDALFYAASYII